VWRDGRIEDLGHADHVHDFASGTRLLTRSVLTFDEADLQIVCTPILTNFLSVGTGYGMDADWRHGMYQGPDTVVHGLVLKVDDINGRAQYGVVDQSARFEYDDQVGYGLYEHGFFGPFEKYGLRDAVMGAP
jgi:hypothetical protein